MNVTFAVGPSQVYPKLEGYLQDAIAEGVLSLSHRGGRFQELYSQTEAELRRLMSIPDDYSLAFISSANECMERVVQNCVADRSHHFVNGAFGQRWYNMAAQLGKSPTKTMAERGRGFWADSSDVPDDAELICAVHSETSTGVELDAALIHGWRERYPDKLVALDMVSSAPYTPVDISAIDCGFFSVQKGFGLPAGLAVLIVSPAALAKADWLRENGYVLGAYHSFPELFEHAGRRQTPETPNVLAIYLLHRVAQDMTERGLDNIRSEMRAQAGNLYRAIEAHPELDLLVQEPAHRSNTVAVARVNNGSRPLMDALSAKGLTVGPGYGPQADTHVRIANFPSHIGHIDRLIGELDNWPAASL